MGYLGQKYDKGLVIQRSPEGSAFQENADVTVDGDTEITPKVGGGFKKVNITGGGGGAAKRVELMDDIDLNDEWDTLDLEGLGIPDFSMTDLDEGKVKFTFNSMDLEFIGRGSVLSNEYYWVPTFEDSADEYAVLQLFNKTTLHTITIILAFMEDNTVQVCGHNEIDVYAQTDLVVTINPLDQNDVRIDTNTWSTDDIESVEELYHKMVHYNNNFITFAWTNVLNESTAFYKGEVEGIVYNRDSDELRIEISCDGSIFEITVYKDIETGTTMHSWRNEGWFAPDYNLYLSLDLNDDEYLDFSILNNILQYMWDIRESELWFDKVGYFIENGENAPIVGSFDAELQVNIDYDQHTVNLFLNTSRGEVTINVMPGQQEGDFTFQVNWDRFEKPGSSSPSSSLIPAALYVENSMKRAVPVVKFMTQENNSTPQEYSVDEFYAHCQSNYASRQNNSRFNNEFNLPTYFILNSAQPFETDIFDITHYQSIDVELHSVYDVEPEDPADPAFTVSWTNREGYIRVTDFNLADGIIVKFIFHNEL